MNWEILAEARIRDWQRRVAAGEAPQKTTPLEMQSIESMLFKEIVGLRLLARDTADADARAHLLQRANNLRIQMLIPLERERPLLARTLSARIEQLAPVQL